MESPGKKKIKGPTPRPGLLRPYPCMDKKWNGPLLVRVLGLLLCSNLIPPKRARAAAGWGWGARMRASMHHRQEATAADAFV